MPGDHIIDLGDVAERWRGQTVTVKAWRSYASQQRVVNARSRGSMPLPKNKAAAKAQASEINIDMDTLAFAEAVVRESVTEWAIVGWDGEPIAAPPGGLRSELMRPDIADAMIGAIEEYYDSLLIPEDELKVDGSA